MIANSVRDGSWAASPVLLAPSLRQASQRTLTVTMSCKQEGGRLGVSSHKCGGKSPSVILSNSATINTEGEESRGEETRREERRDEERKDEERRFIGRKLTDKLHDRRRRHSDWARLN